MKSFGIPFILTAIILSVVYRNNHTPSPDAELINQLYGSSHDTLRIDTSDYFLETFLCRKMSDNGTAGQNDVSALVYLVNAGNLRIPMNVRITNLFIINGEDIWASSTASPDKTEFKLTEVSENGPVWQSDAVDVIAETEDTLTKIKRYVIVRNQHFEDL